jgi:hypothetical protein
MPRCQAVCADEPGAAPASCLYAGWLDELCGFKLYRSHNKLGLVKSADALQFLEPVRLDSLSVQQLVASLFSGCPGGELSLHNNLGAKLCSLLSATDLANVEAACKAELARRRMEQQSSDLTKCIELQNGGLKPPPCALHSSVASTAASWQPAPLHRLPPPCAMLQLK